MGGDLRAGRIAICLSVLAQIPSDWAAASNMSVLPKEVANRGAQIVDKTGFLV